MKVYFHPGSFARLALHADICVVQKCSVFYDGESQAGSAAFPGMTFIYPIEAFENTFLMFLGNTDSGILHNNPSSLKGVPHPDTDFSAFFIILYGIFCNVKNHLVNYLADTEILGMLSAYFQMNFFFSAWGARRLQISRASWYRSTFSFSTSTLPSSSFDSLMMSPTSVIMRLASL